MDPRNGPLVSPWKSGAVALRCSPEWGKWARAPMLTGKAACVFNSLCFVREYCEWRWTWCPLYVAEGGILEFCGLSALIASHFG